MSIQPVRRLFTVTEYYRMAEAGILSEDDRVELIEGEIIEMTPIGSRHSACVDRLSTLFHLHLGKAVIIRVQNPVRLDERSEPQPDVSLLKPRKDYYAEAHPTPDDVLLIIEVSETSIDYDRRVKLPLYARALIPEVWLVDIPGDRIEVHKQPSKEIYQEPRYIQRGQHLSP
ncbi:MAG TPA: Uma2 family endonuclease [Thermodesulfobacteriota bacterium]|nr:Uma2 family endonuclease [Thermodesulfobacteriota bacterium]